MRRNNLHRTNLRVARTGGDLGAATCTSDSKNVLRGVSISLLTGDLLF